MDTIGIKVKSYNSIAQVISILRKYTPVSMTEIKDNIEKGNMVFEQDYINHSGIRKVRKCYDELTKAGVLCEIIDEDEEIISREILSNLIESHQITEKEVYSQMKEEAEDDKY